MGGKVRITYLVNGLGLGYHQSVCDLLRQTIWHEEEREYDDPS